MPKSVNLYCNQSAMKNPYLKIFILSFVFNLSWIVLLQGQCNGNGIPDGMGGCICNVGFSGATCNQCDTNYYNYPNCTFCQAATSCNGRGICASDGSCLCNPGFCGSSCQFSSAVNCSNNGDCTFSGMCNCDIGFMPPNCNACAPNYYNYPTCTFCQAAVTCNGNGACDSLGDCDCNPGFSGPNCETVLPVLFTYFTVENKLNSPLLRWQSAYEVNNAGFEVQKSIDGKDWNKIAFVHGHGFSTAPKSYTFKDVTPSIGTIYYRLKQVDFDQNAVFSEIISIEVLKSNHLELLIFPNPAKDQLRIQLPNSFSANANTTIILYDYMGRRTRFLQRPGAQTYNINLSIMSPGMYILEIISDQNRWKKRLAIK